MAQEPHRIGDWDTEGFWSGEKNVTAADLSGKELLRFVLPFPMLVTLECSSLPDTGIYLVEYGDERFVRRCALLPGGFLADSTVKGPPIAFDRWVIVTRQMLVTGFHPGIGAPATVTLRANAALGPTAVAGDNAPLQAGRTNATEATVVPVAQSAVAVDLLTPLAAQFVRVGATIVNNAAATLYIRLDPGVAALAQFSVAIPPGGTFEMPEPWWSGRVSGIWAAAGGGNAMVTEWHVQRF